MVIIVSQKPKDDVLTACCFVNDAKICSLLSQRSKWNRNKKLESENFNSFFLKKSLKPIIQQLGD